MAVRSHGFRTKGELAESLAAAIAEALGRAIERDGKAVLAVSGGSTPKLMFEKLSRTVIDWSKVSVTLVDERWVDDRNERSNARLVKTHLLKNSAAGARFVPLYEAAETPETGLERVSERIGALGRPTAVILGMGADGHTASFFPGGDCLHEATDLATDALVSPMRAEGAGEPRITLTLPVILSADFLALHIEGAEKSEVLEKALTPGPIEDLPIRAVLSAPDTELHIYWTG